MQSQQRPCRGHDVSPHVQAASLRLRLAHSLFFPMGSDRVAAGRSTPDMHRVRLPFDAWELVHSQQMACLSQSAFGHGHCWELIA
jgi:hypothetical protein